MVHPNLYADLIGRHAVMVTIPREDIECGNVDDAVAALNKLVASREALEDSNGTLALLVGGYDDDPRELHLIPEVRAYFKELDALFPYWFHVCVRIENTLQLLLTLLIELTPVALADPPGAIGYRFDHDDLNTFVQKQLDEMEALHRIHGFDQATSQRIRELVINYYSALIE